MEDDDKKILGALIIIVLFIGFLFLVPVKDGEPVLSVENGKLETPIGDSGGVGDLDGGDDGTTPDDGTDDNQEEPQGEPCTYPESFDIPTREWWFSGNRCPTSVKSFFDESEEVDCYEVESTGNPYDYRREITSWYDDYVQDLNWKQIDVESGYVNREDCWAWGSLYYCEYEDKGMIALYVFCPASTSRTGTGVWGQTLGDWEYISRRAEDLSELISEMTE